MTANFDLYGSHEDLESARIRAEEALGVKMIAHESGFHGGCYYRLDLEHGEHLVLQRNFDSFEDAWFEEEFKAYSTLLYVNKTQRSREFEALLKSNEHAFDLLRRETI